MKRRKKASKKQRKRKKRREEVLLCIVNFFTSPFLSFFLIHSFPLVLLPSIFTGTSNLPPTPLPGWRNPRVASWWRQTRCVYVEGMKMPAPELRRWCNSCEMQAPTPPSSHRYPQPPSPCSQRLNDSRNSQSTSKSSLPFTYPFPTLSRMRSR